MRFSIPQVSLLAIVCLLIAVCTYPALAQQLTNVSAQQSTNVSAQQSTNVSGVVGGSIEDNANFPWVVHLGNCHGTLIAPRWVLTSAHCSLIPFPSVNHIATGATRSSDKVVKHPDYVDGNTNNDLALVRLTNPFPTHPLLKMAELPLSSGLVGEVGVAASTKAHGSTVPPGKLAVYRVPIDHVTADEKEFFLDASHITLCEGDSGSGYVVGGGGKYFVIGVASGEEGFGTSLCSEGTGTGIFVRMPNVFAFNTWIRSVTGLAAPPCCFSMSDILWRNANGVLSLWFMNQASVIGVTNPSYYGQTVPSDWKVQSVGRFFSDLYHPGDILWRDNFGNLAMWKTDGGELVADTYPTYQSSGVPTSNDWQIAGSGDFDGFGTNDILWRDTSGHIAIWFIRDGQFLGELYPPSLSSGWFIRGVGDFNGDRYSDILFRHNEGGMAIWLNHCQQGCTIGAGGATNDWQIAGTGFFNDDSYSDILWRDTDGSVAVWLGLGNGYSWKVEYPNTHWPYIPGQDWQIQKIGDFNGDRYSDILWRNIDGTVHIWFMYGGLVIGGGSPGVVTNDWSIIDVGHFN